MTVSQAYRICSRCATAESYLKFSSKPHHQVDAIRSQGHDKSEAARNEVSQPSLETHVMLLAAGTFEAWKLAPKQSSLRRESCAWKIREEP
jgi:hypothetical protein